MPMGCWFIDADLPMAGQHKCQYDVYSPTKTTKGITKMNEAAEGMPTMGWVGLGLFAAFLIWRIIESKKNTGTYTGGIFGGGGGSKPPTHHK